MKSILLTVVFSLGLGLHVAFGSPVSAKDKTAKKLGFIDISKVVLEQGYDKNINSPISLRLGYESESVPTKAKKFSAKSSPDGVEHTFFVVYDKSDGKLVAKEVVIGAVKVTGKDDKKFVEGTAFRSRMDGGLLGAMVSKGFVGEVSIESRSITDPAVKSAFEKERRYFETALAKKSFDP